MEEAGVGVSAWWGAEGLSFCRSYLPLHDNGDIALRQALGFQYYKLPGDNYGFSGVTLPYWFCVLTLAIWPALAAWRRYRGNRSGFCPHCGYDLRATPERCPECGRTAPRE
jgi:hypothetical protein